jgi:vitamin B12 transporter
MSLRIRVPFLALIVTLGAIARPTAAQTPVELEGVVVTAAATPLDLSRLGNHVSLLDGQALVARGITHVADALREVPGLAVVRNGSFGGATSVFFRGGESDYVQILIDGVQVNQPGGAYDLAGLTTENVERIEVVRGPSSALHGSDAVAGVIHIITRTGGGPTETNVQFRTGSFGRIDTSVGVNGGSGAASYGVSLARYRTDGILAFNNRFQNTVLSGRAQLALDGRTTASVAARIAERQFNFPTDFSGTVVDTNQFSFNDETSFSVSVDRRLSGAVSLRALVTTHSDGNGNDDRPDSPADTLGFFGSESLNSFRRTALDLRSTFEFGREQLLTLGAEVETQRIRSFNASESQYGPSSSRSALERDNRAVYAHASGSVGTVSLNGGWRIEDNERFGASTTWQIGASYAIGESTRIRGVTGRAIKEPTFFETFAVGFARGNPDLDPEVSTSWEVGVEHAMLGGNLWVQVTRFEQAFEDLIQYSPVPEVEGGPNYFNIAEADARGLEVSARAEVGPVRLFGDVTRLDTEVIDSGFDSGPGASFVTGEALLRRPRNSGRAGVNLSLGRRYHLEAVARYTGDRADRDFNAFPAAPVTLDGYTLVDLGLNGSLVAPRGGRPGLDLSLRLENLTDERYEEVFGFATPGRGVYLGGRLLWGGR